MQDLIHLIQNIKEKGDSYEDEIRDIVESWIEHPNLIKMFNHPILKQNDVSVPDSVYEYINHELYQFTFKLPAIHSVSVHVPIESEEAKINLIVFHF